MVTEKMRVSASSIISSAAETHPMPASTRRKPARSRSFVEAFMTVGGSVALETWGKLTPVPPSAAARVRATNHYLLCALAWAIPGAAHLFLGRRKRVFFLVVLPALFACGLLLHGRIFPIVASPP